MPRPTAAELVERLREVHEAQTGSRLSDEKLAGRLPITLSTLNRWKKGDTRQFAEIVAMLDEAGWLSPAAAAAAAAQAPASIDDRLADLQADVSSLLLGQAEALTRIDAVLERATPGQARPAPKRT